MSPTIESLIQNTNRVGIVSHDAGGANILNALVKRFKDIDFYLLVKGPAMSIFDAENAQFIEDENKFFDNIDLVLFGTGHTPFEKIILRHAKILNLTSIAILDHFVNFRERFIYKEKICMPDYCFVCDEYSFQIAKKELTPYKNILICENYFLSHIIREISAVKSPQAKAVLYVLEDIKEHFDNKLSPWEVAFNNFYENFYKDSDFEKIIVRPHPKDKPSKYQALEKYKEVIFDYNISPIESLGKVSTVIGVESYLLYLAHQCGLNVYTSMPNGVRSPSLPKHCYKFFGN